MLTVADRHPASTDRAIAVKDVEFEESEMRFGGPVVGLPFGFYTVVKPSVRKAAL
jgi:hypothetical protein